jgi:hypothetical protein
MSNLPEDANPEHWQRYFAIEFNNRAWSLTTRPRSADEDREMLNTAHASALHWNAIGTELNRMRRIGRSRSYMRFMPMPR